MHSLTNVSAIEYSAFRLNATLTSLTEFASVAELSRFQFSEAPVVLGEGSNTIFMQDLAVPLCRFSGSNKTVIELDKHNMLLHVEAGHNWHELVQWAVAQQFWGLENLALIPGSVGAAPVQNIGAYGVEFADSCLYVDFFHWQSAKVERIVASRCQFGYRDSVFKQRLHRKGIIVAVGLNLSRVPKPVLSYQGLDELTDNPTIEDIFQKVIAIRSSKLPDPNELANCGSFFKNPVISADDFSRIKLNHPSLPGYRQADNTVKVPAAWLIDQQGFKGARCGDIGSYVKQPLVLVNYGSGTAAELAQYVSLVQQKVAVSYGIELEPEVRMLNSVGLAYEQS